MTDPKPIDQVIRKIKKKWDSDPENWSVLSNIDRDGNREMLISQAPNTYWLKMRAISPISTMTYGRELTNIDDEIDKKLGKTNPKKSQEELLQLFGMMVPSKKDVIYTSGVEKVDPEQVNLQKEKVEEKDPHADRMFRLYLQKKWEREQQLRDNMYL